jgi:hypothetical protein
MRKEQHREFIIANKTVFWYTGSEAKNISSCPCTGYLGHPFKNKLFETENDQHHLLVNRGGLVYNQTSLTASSCSNDDTLRTWRSFLYG